MDDGRFDAFAVRLGTVGRRGFLKVLLGLGGAAVTSAVLLVDTDAARRGFSGPSLPMPAPETKVEICHAVGNGSFRLMSVAPEALSAHLAHGDGQLGTKDHCSACGDACASNATCESSGCVAQGSGTDDL